MKRDFPDGWTDRLTETGDLETALIELDSYDGFFSIGLRARMLSLLMRLPEAVDQFKHAATIGDRWLDKNELTEKSLRHQSIIFTYCVENDLLIGLSDGSTCKRVAVCSNVCLLLRKLSKIDQALLRLVRSQTGLLGRIYLDSGEDEKARVAFTEAIEHSHSSEAVGIWECGLACAFHNLGDEKSRDLSLENAAFCANLAGDKVNAANLFSRLYAIHRTLGNDRSSKEWRTRIRMLCLPSTSEEAFLERAQILIDRSSCRERLITV